MPTDILYPLRCFHGFLHEQKERYVLKNTILKEFYAKRKKNPKTVFLVLTPEHGNLGDHAIALSITNILKQCGINYVEITGAQLYKAKQHNILGLFNKYPILINGGGNLGTLWFGIEDIFRQLILKNAQSPIICFPNTIFYHSTQDGQKEFEKSIQIYNKHKNLHLYAREKISYDIMRKAYKNVDLVPDMVLALNKSDMQQKREGCLLCLRNDCEKTRTKTQEQQIRNQAEQLFGNAVRDTDMIAEHNIPVTERETALQEKFEEFSKAQLVITDRLHGMIFCAVTGTPCIVVDSKSPKVHGCYEWIKHLNYICFVDAPEQIVQTYRSIPDGPHKYDNSDLMPYYDKIANDILEILNWK
ncbi:hypothetical protein B5F36_10235 [Anaerofilum sp. An201]|nr:polysaccharide pyruvyl transferase family protein [Anaerofilum sp. An201]OUP02962.1 hypothetical protein B5F36_10235 [Anaerofilum sp. An201]